MSEQGNQTEVMNIDEQDYFLPEGFTDDAKSFDEEVSTDTIEEGKEENATESEEQASDDEEVEKKLSEYLGENELKVNKDMINIDEMSKDDLKAALQKGLNYDYKLGKQQEKLDVALMQASDFKEVAEMYNMDTGQLLTALRDKIFADVAKRDQRNIEDVRKEFMAGKKDLQTLRIERFLKKYPDINAESLPEEVLNAGKLGEELTDAYERHLKEQLIADKDSEIEELKAKIEGLEKEAKVKKQNTKSKKKGVVKPVSGSDDVGNDDFLAGFYGE